MSTTSFVRTELVAAAPPPRSARGLWLWMRKNLFATPTDTLLTG
jgi:general L-amino acid transport system permease protein